MVEWEAIRVEEGELSRVEEGKAFERVAVEGVGEEAVGDQDEEEEAREVVRLLELLLELEELSVEVEEATGWEVRTHKTPSRATRPDGRARRANRDAPSSP